MRFMAAPPRSYRASAYALFFTAGAFHLPLSASSFGQYNRMAQKNGPLGAGSQFDSLSAPGESC